MALTPEAEPPGGFESAVLARVAGRDGGSRRARLGPAPGRWRPRCWPLPPSPAGPCTLPARNDRELAASGRRTLAVAGGEYFVAFALVDGDGRQQGMVFGYQGEPAWVVLVVEEPLTGGRSMHRRAGRPR